MTVWQRKKLTARTPAWLSVLKDYWWLGGIVAGGILLWGNLPERVKKVEAGQANQQEELGAIRDATQEIKGYLKGQQALNERLAAQQQANAPYPLPEPRTSDDSQELSDDGEIKLMRWTDEEGKVHKMCCTGTECWPWHKQTRCAR